MWGGSTKEDDYKTDEVVAEATGSIKGEEEEEGSAGAEWDRGRVAIVVTQRCWT